MRYHAVMLDECGFEFGVTFDAPDRGSAWDYVREEYPESRCIQMEDPTDTQRREDRIWKEICGDDWGY